MQVTEKKRSYIQQQHGGTEDGSNMDTTKERQGWEMTKRGGGAANITVIIRLGANHVHASTRTRARGSKKKNNKKHKTRQSALVSRNV